MIESVTEKKVTRPQHDSMENTSWKFKVLNNWLLECLKNDTEPCSCKFVLVLKYDLWHLGFAKKYPDTFTWDITFTLGIPE